MYKRHNLQGKKFAVPRTAYRLAKNTGAPASETLDGRSCFVFEIEE